MPANDHLKPATKTIAVGETAPDFTLPDQDKKEWKLSEHLKKGEVVLCFYPMAFSPVCATEMKCITEEMSTWRQKGLQVVGLSADSFYAQKAWADQLGLEQPLLADMHRQVCKAYGLYWPDLNISSRGTVIIAQNGKVKWVQAREPGKAMNFDEVLASA